MEGKRSKSGVRKSQNVGDSPNAILRRCSKCHCGVLAPKGDLIRCCSCPDQDSYVHKKCLADYMVKTGRIACLQCGERFTNIRYSYTPKVFLQYCLEDQTKYEFIKLLSTVFSLLMSLFTILKVFSNADDVKGTLSRFDFTWKQYRANVDICNLLHSRVFAPILLVQMSITQLHHYQEEYFKWHSEVFNVRIEEKPSSLERRGIIDQLAES